MTMNKSFIILACQINMPDLIFLANKLRSKRISVTDRRGKLNLDAKAVHPAWYLPTTLTPNSKTWAGPYWRDCWVVGAAGSNAALWQLLYLGAGNGNGTPRVSSDQTDLRIKCLAWATFRNRTWGCLILWGQNGSVHSDDEESLSFYSKKTEFICWKIFGVK